MKLKQISKVFVQFSPWNEKSVSAREFLARVSSKNAKTSNPDCKISSAVRVKGDPLVQVEFDNKHVELLNTSAMKVNDIITLIKTKADEMETMGKLKAAGFGNEQLHSPLKLEIGEFRKVERL